MLDAGVLGLEVSPGFTFTVDTETAGGFLVECLVDAAGVAGGCVEGCGAAVITRPAVEVIFVYKQPSPRT